MLENIWIESIVRDDPNDRGENMLFVITYTVLVDGVIKRFRKKSCGAVGSAELHPCKGADFLYIGFESIDLPENTEELPFP